MWEVFLVLFIIGLLARNRRQQRGYAELDPGYAAEMQRLREEVDSLTEQVVRLQDEQQFTMKLLTEGGGPAPAPLPAATPPTAAAAAQPGDAPTDDHA